MTWEWTGEERGEREERVAGTEEADPEAAVEVRRVKGEEVAQEAGAEIGEIRDVAEVVIEMIAREDKRMTSENLRSRRSGRRKVFLLSKKVI